MISTKFGCNGISGFIEEDKNVNYKACMGNGQLWSPGVGTLMTLESQISQFLFYPPLVLYVPNIEALAFPVY